MVYEGWTAAPAVAPAAATAQLDENNTSDGYLQRHEQEMPLRPNGSTAIPEETGSRAPSRQVGKLPLCSYTSKAFKFL